ncbi:hypothetical protein OE749_03460 [Aestuariibacter sp. AA17]|uniref:DUF2884 family protein n=1 Tax=Fluctibacter corallii TaxID=2984329 RepID=A0ABT3A551_9ALTE|nr:hypothetical protein [Aestuariibacter sp. AA17]MCV2883760.1 hypothetical protein [Aestuariibacter sp. AA17]
MSLIKPIILSTLLIGALSASAAHRSDPFYHQTLTKDSEMVALKDCKIVATMPVSDQLIALRQQLTVNESDIELATQPIKAIQPDIQLLSERIQEIVTSAVNTNAGVVTVDQQRLEEAEHLQHELTALINANTVDTAHIEHISLQIEHTADAYVDELKALFGDISFDQIQVRQQGDTSDIYCDHDVKM